MMYSLTNPTLAGDLFEGKGVPDPSALLEGKDQTELLNYMRQQEYKKQRDLQHQLSSTSTHIQAGDTADCDDWSGEWAEDSDLSSLPGRYKTHSTYSFVMQPTSSISSVEATSPRVHHVVSASDTHLTAGMPLQNARLGHISGPGPVKVSMQHMQDSNMQTETRHGIVCVLVLWFTCVTLFLLHEPACLPALGQCVHADDWLCLI